MRIKRPILFFVIALLHFSCSDNQADKKKHNEAFKAKLAKQQNTSRSESGWNYEIFKTEKGFGYTLLENGKKRIHQPTIPAVGGNRGFDSHEKAEKAAKHIIKKINNNIFPPSVSASELDSLKVL